MGYNSWCSRHRRNLRTLKTSLLPKAPVRNEPIARVVAATGLFRFGNVVKSLTCFNRRVFFVGNMNNLFTRYLLFALIPANITVANDDNVAVLKDTVDGKYLNEYPNIWWQWAASMPDQQSAVSDRTGKFCDMNQQGPVRFLAGGYGSSKIKRQCTIPKDKYLFFPVINMVYYDKSVSDPEQPRPKLSCDQVKALAALNNDKLNSFVVTIDNQKIFNPAPHRYISPECFDLMALIPKEYKVPTVPIGV